MPMWTELGLGVLAILAGIWKGFVVEIGKVGQVPEENRQDLVLATEWRDAQVTTGCLWTALGVVSGVGLIGHSIGRMVFGW